MSSILSALDDQILLSEAGAVLKASRRVHIPGVLEETRAQSLHAAMQRLDWRLVLNGANDTYDFKIDDIAAMNPAQQERMLKVVHAKAGPSFQFLFDSHRISDEYDAGRVTTGPLAELYEALNAESALAQLRQLTGEPRIAYLDAQATRYRPGHFLTEHDDDIVGKDRLFAFVLNLTPAWRADWGGLLMFYDRDGHVAEAFTPAWNALNILKVPQSHAVSVVAPFAQGFRYSVTGWMRSKRPTEA